MSRHVRPNYGFEYFGLGKVIRHKHRNNRYYFYGYRQKASHSTTTYHEKNVLLAYLRYVRTQIIAPWGIHPPPLPCPHHPLPNRTKFRHRRPKSSFFISLLGEAGSESEEDTELILGTVFGIFFGLAIILLGAAWLKNRQSRRKVGNSHPSINEDSSPPEEPVDDAETPA